MADKAFLDFLKAHLSVKERSHEKFIGMLFCAPQANESESVVRFEIALILSPRNHFFTKESQKVIWSSQKWTFPCQTLKLSSWSTPTRISGRKTHLAWLWLFSENGRSRLKDASHEKLTRVHFCLPVNSTPFHLYKLFSQRHINENRHKKTQLSRPCTFCRNLQGLSSGKNGAAPKWKIPSHALNINPRPN